MPRQRFAPSRPSSDHPEPGRPRWQRAELFDRKRPANPIFTLN
ncbi:hypothetical protein XBI1_1940006 [Xenorhabdus bovienii str. Intermedium]|uniref:Uncharacterized protein n=1 Tax=Xenorhabdus bovienii str. Intermedium TaxID=1379677 RepID=A0A077QH06_XENBV|nr:hypothetical protein XBI1_1940006 [Xenorhabdus bovienii str. Intermedium]